MGTEVFLIDSTLAPDINDLENLKLLLGVELASEGEDFSEGCLKVGLEQVEERWAFLANLASLNQVIDEVDKANLLRSAACRHALNN